MRRVAILIVVLGVMAPVSPAARDGQGHGENFVLVEEARLPPDTEQAGTSTLDVDLVDVDGDGDLDIYKAQGTDSLLGRPNQLLINTGTGHFVDESAQRLPFENLNSTKADWGDVDGDGDLDGIVAQVGGEQLLLNDGFGVFADSSLQLPAPLPLLFDISADAHFADVDGEGDLDILVSNEISCSLPTEGGSHATESCDSWLPALRRAQGRKIRDAILIQLLHATSTSGIAPRVCRGSVSRPRCGRA